MVDMFIKVFLLCKPPSNRNAIKRTKQQRAEK